MYRGHGTGARIPRKPSVCDLPRPRLMARVRHRRGQGVTCKPQPWPHSRSNLPPLCCTAYRCRSCDTLLQAAACRAGMSRRLPRDMPPAAPPAAPPTSAHGEAALIAGQSATPQAPTVHLLPTWWTRPHPRAMAGAGRVITAPANGKTSPPQISGDGCSLHRLDHLPRQRRALERARRRAACWLLGATVGLPGGVAPNDDGGSRPAGERASHALTPSDAPRNARGT